jgi:putative membrane protein
MKEHPALGLTGWALALLAAVLWIGYVSLQQRVTRRGILWPTARTACFALGCFLLGAASLISLPIAPFTGHMLVHLLVSMVCPVLLVVGRPLTLLLRTLRPGPLRRRLLALMHSQAAKLLLFPPFAGMVSAAGPWLLFRTDALASTFSRPVWELLVHIHFVVAGCVFVQSVSEWEPLRHRRSLFLRATTVLGVAASHAVLAKLLYAGASPGLLLAETDRQTGALLMYYGGDLVEVAIVLLVTIAWYRSGTRQLARVRRRSVAGSPSAQSSPRPSSPLTLRSQPITNSQ